MILDITRGHIEAKISEKIAFIPGEMFRAENGRTGFVVYLDQIDYWEPKAEKQPIDSADLTAILDDIQAEFTKAGFTLELE
jgi:hypothetical protein